MSQVIQKAVSSGHHKNLKALVGSGDKIALFVLPFLVVGLVANILYPQVFAVGGPPPLLTAVPIVALTAGVVIWAWSVVLILTKAARGELITTGPYAWVKHPLYTAVTLLVVPSVGILLNSWLGAAVGLLAYIAARRFGPEEEAELSRTFGPFWTRYADTVKLRWL